MVCEFSHDVRLSPAISDKNSASSSTELIRTCRIHSLVPRPRRIYMALNKAELVHKDLCVLRDQLRHIYRSAASFEPLTPRPPIIDTSTDDEDTQWRSENVPGMRLLRDAIKGDLERLETVSYPTCQWICVLTKTLSSRSVVPGRR